MYVGFGITGVRGEAEQGFPLVCQIGLPALHQALDNGLAWREALIHTLLTLMAHCDDTTVLFRGGQQALAEMKQYARRLVTQGGMFNPAIEQQLADFNSWCMDKWVSPGGSADLLALCLAMYFLCRQPQGDIDIRKNMNIYFYTLLTYGLTIVISFAVVGIIVGVNKMMIS